MMAVGATRSFSTSWGQASGFRRVSSQRMRCLYLKASAVFKSYRKAGSPWAWMLRWPLGRRPLGQRGHRRPAPLGDTVRTRGTGGFSEASRSRGQWSRWTTRRLRFLQPAGPASHANSAQSGHQGSSACPGTKSSARLVLYALSGAVYLSIGKVSLAPFHPITRTMGTSEKTSSM